MSKFGGGAKCDRCKKTVYAAEEVIANNKKYHKLCFTCKTCNKSLDSTNCTDREGDIYCKPCYGRFFGPKGYGFGGGAGTLSMENEVEVKNCADSLKEGAKTGPTINRIEPSQPKAEKTEEVGELKIAQIRNVPKYPGVDRCPRCDKAVYMAEKVIGAGQVWHKLCFNCYSCSKFLDSTSCTDKGYEIYCKSCYAKNFGPKGYGYGGGAGTMGASS